MIKQYEVTLPDFGRGFHLITNFIENEISQLPECGLLNIFIKHTSAGLTINENADPSVRVDFENIFNHLIKENESYYTHTIEDSDDMSAHVKSSLVNQSLTIPIKDGRLNMGVWQGIYLCEFRKNGGRRKIVLTIYS